MQLIENGKLTVPLYHGSSSLFIRSIVQHGLGGRNIVAEMNVVEFLKLLYPACVELLADDLSWQVSELSFRHMMEQRMTARSNYRHGSAYLSPSRRSAGRYALHKEYGSEIVTYALRFFDAVADIDPARVCALEATHSELLSFRGVQRWPVMVRATGVCLSGLKSERGEAPELVVNEMLSYVESSGLEAADEMWEQSNFEAITPIPVEQLQFYRFRVMDDCPYIPLFELGEFDPLTM